MSIERCSVCAASIDTDREEPEYTGDGKPLCFDCADEREDSRTDTMGPEEVEWPSQRTNEQRHE